MTKTAAKKRPGQAMQFTTVNDMLCVPEESSQQITDISLDLLDNLKGFPYPLNLDTDMAELTESIAEYGIEEPIKVRPMPEGRYEIVIGHRRVYACRLLKYSVIPAIIETMDDDSAVIRMFNSNLKRNEILPSSKACLYKMTLDAMNRQGQRTDLTYSQVGNKLKSEKSSDILAQKVGESKNQIYRYIRLTHLHKKLLALVDSKTIKLNVGVEISYLEELTQIWLCEFAEKGLVPSLAQVKKIREYEKKHELTKKKIEQMLTDDREAKQTVSLKLNDIKAYFPPDTTPQEIQTQILRLLDNWKNRRA